MHLYFLNEKAEPVFGPYEHALSLVYTERFLRTGSFTLTLPMTDVDVLSDAHYLLLAGEDVPTPFTDGRRTLGRIERTVYDTQKRTVTVSGRLAESLLSERFIARGTHEQGTVKQVIERVLAANAIGYPNDSRAIPYLSLEALPNFVDETGNRIVIDEYPSGRVLEDWLRAVLARYGASYRITYDERKGDCALRLSVYQSCDRTSAQTEHAPVIFSSSLATLGSAKLLYDTSLYRNYVFVAGRGEGDARLTLTLDARKTSDEPLRELYMDARSLDTDGTTSDTAYLKLMRNFAKEKLDTYRDVVRIEGESTALGLAAADGQMTLCAGRDFSLGDLCDVSLDTPSMTVSERVTAIETKAEDGTVTHRAMFGAEYPSYEELLKQ